MPKINLKTLAYNTIRSKIVTCQYAPGTFLNEEQLTTELSLSRTPVRDALDVSSRKVFWKSARNAESSFVL
ncbi:MAG: GntR family transcriptional regulator [Roseburia sp.]